MMLSLSSSPRCAACYVRNLQQTHPGGRVVCCIPLLCLPVPSTHATRSNIGMRHALLPDATVLSIGQKNRSACLVEGF